MTLDEIDKQAVVASYMDEGDTFAWASIICPDFLNVPRDSAPYSNVEALLNYGPDIVFTIEKNSISKYESVGIPTAYVEFTDYEKFQESITLMAEVIGGDAPSIAKNYCDYMNGNIELVEERLADLPDDERPTVYYMDGRTPNPCIWCNQKVKFGAMVDYARSVMDFDFFATGHYARVRRLDNGRYALLKARDLQKDQSYFLSRLSQSQLSSVLFPLGEHLKSEIREIDEILGFHEKGQTESQDFYGGDYAELIGAEDRPGEIVTEDGRVVGHHNGFWHYTIGQRRGLGIAYSEPLYVISIDPAGNRVIVGTEKSTHASVLHASDAVFGAYEDFDPEILYSVKIRSMAKDAAAHVVRRGDGFDVFFSEYVKGAAPGQSAVVYDGDTVVASGIISGGGQCSGR